MAAASVGGESSPSTAESSFRELDDVFLQSQTRIWIGEVLQQRLDEQQNVSDLLADGDLLFGVSKVLWKMLTTSYIARRHIKVDKCRPLALRKSIGRYAPYSNVDTFLKVCKMLGLDGIDLFSPSDVVEKKDIRKVCMCIRSLSKKARSESLHVPDFDSVTYTIAMPTDMVGCIRRSLELSQLNTWNSNGHDNLKDSREKCNQKFFVASCSPNNNQHSLDFGDTEINYMVAKSSRPCTDLESSEITDFSSATIESKCEAGDNRKEVHTLDECGSQCTDHSVESRFVRHEGRNTLTDMSSSTYIDSEELGNRFLNLYSGLKHANKNAHLDLASGTSLADPVHNSTSESGYTVQHSPISDLTDDGDDIIDTFLFDVEDSILKGMDSESDGSNSTQTTAKSGCELRLIDNAEDAEVSSVASINSVSSKVQKLNFEDHCNFRNYVGDYQARISKWQGVESDLMNNVVTVRGYEPQGVNTYEGTSVRNLIPNTEKPSLDMGVEDCGPSSMRSGSCLDWQSYTSYNSDNVYDLENMDSDLHEGFLFDQSDSSLEFLKWADNHKSAMETVPNVENCEASIEFAPFHNSSRKLLHRVPASGEVLQFRADPDMVIEDSEKCHKSSATNDTCQNSKIQGNKQPPEKLCSPINFSEVEPRDPDSCSEVKNRDDDSNHESSRVTANVPNVNGSRGPKNKLLKVAASGTAIFGLLFIFDQFRRRNAAERAHVPRTQPDQARKKKTIGSSPKGERGGRADSVYPAEKLKLRA